jgi:hypothetical protein
METCTKFVYSGVQNIGKIFTLKASNTLSGRLVHGVL